MRRRSVGGGLLRGEIEPATIIVVAINGENRQRRGLAIKRSAQCWGCARAFITSASHIFFNAEIYMCAAKDFVGADAIVEAAKCVVGFKTGTIFVSLMALFGVKTSACLIVLLRCGLCRICRIAALIAVLIVALSAGTRAKIGVIYPAAGSIMFHTAPAGLNAFNSFGKFATAKRIQN